MGVVMMCDDEEPNEETGEFSVCQFFSTGVYRYTCRFVKAAKAYETAWQLATSASALLGTTNRVIITDAFDCTNWEWQHGKGVVHPEGWTLEGPPHPTETREA